MGFARYDHIAVYYDAERIPAGLEQITSALQRSETPLLIGCDPEGSEYDVVHVVEVIFTGHLFDDEPEHEVADVRVG